MKSHLLTFLFLVTALFGCIEPYEPPVIEDFDELMVIDGNVNGTTGEASVVLSTSQALYSIEPTKYIAGADVTLIKEDGTIYQLNDFSTGKYVADNISLQYGDKIKLMVVNQGVQYASDFEEYIKTPAIDSVSLDSNESGVQFYVTTHDPQNNTFYYKWEYEETWEFSSRFISGYYYDIVEGEMIVNQRYRPDTLYSCYKNDKSTSIIIGSSKRLSKDVISEYPVAFINNSTAKFRIRYSILVKQQALSERSYNYWSLLQTNTESLGSIFDPQPSQINSNIVNVNDPKNRVLGFFNVYSETELRKSIGYSDVAPHDYVTGYEGCQRDSLLNDELLAGIDGRYLVNEILDGGPSPIGYTVAFSSCVDCRLRGSNIIPEFWQ